MHSFLNATDVTSRFWLSCYYLRYDDGTNGFGLYTRQILCDKKVLVTFSYRRTLFGITIIIGLMIAQFSLQSPDMSIYYLVLPLFLLGVVMSIQFTSMNTISLADLTDNNASSGNSVLAVTQQLAISFGIAVSASILNYFDAENAGSTVDNFHYTFYYCRRYYTTLFICLLIT